MLVDLDQDPIGWKFWKLTALAISPTHSLFVAQRPPTHSQGNEGKFLGNCRCGVGAISLKRVKLEENLLWIMECHYRNLPTLFRTVPSSTPYSLLFPNVGGSQPPPKTSIAIISGTGELYGLQIWLVYLQRPSEQKPLKVFG